MTGLFRAPAVSRAALAALALCACAVPSVPLALALQPAPDDRAASGQVVKLFDFDERPRGNFEDTPMHWQRLTGEGLPAYSSGQFDEQVGHNAPPSFRFTLRGGNIGYEYVRDDLEVAAGTEYRLTGNVRTEGLRCARAFIASYLVDGGGERIADSERISQLAGPSGASGSTEAATWQRVEIPVRVDVPEAVGLRLQLWVLQAYVFDGPPTAADPITSQDVNARIWFDDIALVRLPRIAVSLSNPGGLVMPDVEEALLVDVQNTAPAPLLAELVVIDDVGREQLRTALQAAPHATEQFRVPLPTLPPAAYQAEVHTDAPDGRIGDAESAPFVQRAFRFAVLPDLGTHGVGGTDFGVDLGAWPAQAAAGLSELVAGLGCGGVKVGLPIADPAVDPATTERLRRARDFAQEMALLGIEATGVILPPPGNSATHRATTYRTLTADVTWEEQLGPLLASFGGHLGSWQLGGEAVDLRESPVWDEATLRRFRGRLERFTTVPRLVVPRAVLDVAATPGLLDSTLGTDRGPMHDETAAPAGVARGAGLHSIWVPAELPTPSLPWHLAGWLRPAADTHFGGSSGPAAPGPVDWISLEGDDDRRTDPRDRRTDLARRVVLAKAANAARVYVPAPFELTTSGGQPTWQPTDQYIPLRTLFRALSGARAVSTLTCADDAVILLFQRGHEYLLVAWTWRDTPDQNAVELFAGPAASAITLSGATSPLGLDGPRARVSLSPEPIIIREVDGALLRLQDSFAVEPAFVQLHDPEPPPVLTLCNPYDQELTGTIELEVPAAWQVTPNPIRIQLGPGEILSEALRFEFPPRQIASRETLVATVSVQSPHRLELRFEVPLEIGLRDIATEVTPWWEGDDLLVRQVVHNTSDQAVSFDGFCQPPERAPLESLFLRIGPGESAIRTYRLPDARALAGSRLWLGIREIGGPRALDLLVSIPP